MEKALLGVFLLLVPTQLGKHWWPEWSYVLGIRVDYLSPTLYLIDLVWVVLFLMSNVKCQMSNVRKVVSFKTVLGVLLVFGNVLVAENRMAAVYWWWRMWQWWWMVGYLRRKKEWTKSLLIKVIPVWIIGESLLGLGQMMNGGSLGGWLYWLGERDFRLTTVGIAQMRLWGDGLIRAYGTFSHPNSLAGFLLLALFYWIKTEKKKKIFYWMVVWSGILGIVLAGSRWVWLLGVFLLVKSLKLKVKNYKRVFGLGLVLAGVVLLVLAAMKDNYELGIFLGGWDSESFNKRAKLNLVAVKMLKENWWLGVGGNNFLVRLPEYQKSSQFYWLQPVHNVVLLILAEVGVLGGLWWGTRWLEWWKGFKLRGSAGMILGIVLVTGMMDHYWVSLPQNRWLLGIILAVLV